MHNKKSRAKSSVWNDNEIFLLQWVVFAYMDQRGKRSHELVMRSVIMIDRGGLETNSNADSGPECSGMFGSLGKYTSEK